MNKIIIALNKVFTPDVTMTHDANYRITSFKALTPAGRRAFPFEATYVGMSIDYIADMAHGLTLEYEEVDA